MHCIESWRAARRWLSAGAAALVLLSCAIKPLPPEPEPALPSPSPVPSTPAANEAVVSAPVAAPPEVVTPTEREPRYVRLAAPSTPSNAAELKLQFARRLVAAHPDTSYTAPAPERLWAIPVIETELNADGSVRRIDVLRQPSTGPEATLLAIEAIRRAAPYGNVSRLPKPWTVVEVFLFDDDLRFKPRTLDIE